MALEAVIYSQDPLGQGCYFRDMFSSFGSFNFDPCYASSTAPVDQHLSCTEWDHYPPTTNNSPPTVEERETHYGFSAPCGTNEDVAAVVQKKRRRRSTKNKEEVENQRMTHIAVERNRRKQMNDYLAAIRSLMPSSYVQRGDQASIVGGAINYVKELEQQLQSLEAQKNTYSKPKEDDYMHQILNNRDEYSAPFSDLFTFPQYSRSHGDVVTAAGEIEVNMAESHANVKILSKRQPKQLLKLVAGFQTLRLSVLHVNVTTTVDGFTLYSFSLKVEEGCVLNSVEEIAAAANHILGS